MNALASADSSSSAATATAIPLLGRRRKPPRRRNLLAVAAVASGLVGWQIWDRAVGTEPPAPTYTTAAALRTDVISKVTATGTLSPVVQVEVGSQVSGRIEELLADYNSVVEKGQVIARLDPQQTRSALASARARLASARADYQRAVAVAENAAAQYQRIRSLVSAGAVSVSEVDSALSAKRSAEAQVSAARSAITVAKAAVEQAELDLSFTTIASPIDGVVVSRNVDVGQTVAASLSAPVLFVIAEDLRKMQVHTSVAESDVGQLRPGMEVEFSVDAFPSRTFTGTVEQVRYEATNVSNVVTYDAVVQVENPDLTLRPGMTANVTFIVSASRNALAIPNRALGYRPKQAEDSVAGVRRGAMQALRDSGAGRDERRANGGRREGERGDQAHQRRIFVLRDGVPTPLRIELGMTDGTQTEVVGGELEPGDEIVIADSSGASAAPGSAGAGATREARRGDRRRGRRRGPPSVF